MDEHEIDVGSIIDRILWGKSVVSIDVDGQEYLFILRSLSIKETNLAKHIYEKELKNAISNSLMKNDDLTNLYRETGDWNDEKDQYVVALKSEIKQLKHKLAQSQFMKHRSKVVSKMLSGKEIELQTLESEKVELFSHSAENRADEIRRRFIVMWSTETMDESPYWATQESFLQEENHILIYKLAIAYFQNNLFSEKDLRKVSRSGLWRYRWKMAKGGADIFGKPIAEWSEMQNLIVYWSQIYDFVYESPDRPAENVVENDALCDSWIQDQNRQSGVASPGRKTEYNILGTKKAKTNKAHQEQFIMVDRGDKEGIERVQSTNAPAVRDRMRKEKKIIHKKKGRIKEFELRKGVLPNGERCPLNPKKK